MKKCFQWKDFNSTALAIIAQAETILDSYAAQGYRITLRTLYYQFVARDLFPESRRDKVSGTKNTEKNYKWLGGIISDARLAGLLDWKHLQDSGREKHGGDGGWGEPRNIIRYGANNYSITHWDDQPQYVECLPPTQRILTSEGLKPICEIVPGDSVLTGNGRFRSVIEVITNKYDGPMLTVRAAGLLPFQVTANHPVLTAHWDTSRPGYKGAERKFGEREFDRADNLRPFDLLSVPLLTETQEVKPVIMRSAAGRARSIEVPWDSALQAVVGLYLAEGYVRKDNRTVQFTIGVHEPEHWRALAEWAKTAGISTGTAVVGGARHVYLYSASLAHWLHGNFGTLARGKRIPQWLLEAPGDGQMEVARWYFKGDGHVDFSRNALVASSRSDSLMQYVALIMIRNGYLPHMHATEDHGEPRYEVVVSGQSGSALMQRWGHTPEPRVKTYNHLRTADDSMSTPVREVTAEHYSGLVYNLEVEEDHTYCVPAVIHNCWVEKQALEDIVARPCLEWNVPYFACKGYVSQSSMYEAAMRLRGIDRGRTKTIIHLGDHDPSGIDMSRDIQDRLSMFGANAYVKRIALNMHQVEAYDPPPSPAKITDSRAADYIDNYGEDSWELDALEPSVLNELITGEITSRLDMDLYNERLALEERERGVLVAMHDHYDDLHEYMVREGLISGEESD